MNVGLLTLHFQIPGCTSLKEKRSRIKPLLARLHREFNISTAEIDRNDAWKETLIGCALVSNDPAHTQRALQEVVRWVENSWPDLLLIDESIQIL
jgi:uncharacterized protein YlxP (DUF503 family)